MLLIHQKKPFFIELSININKTLKTSWQNHEGLCVSNRHSSSKVRMSEWDCKICKKNFKNCHNVSVCFWPFIHHLLIHMSKSLWQFPSFDLRSCDINKGSSNSHLNFNITHLNWKRLQHQTKQERKEESVVAECVWSQQENNECAKLIYRRIELKILENVRMPHTRQQSQPLTSVWFHLYTK